MALHLVINRQGILDIRFTYLYYCKIFTYSQQWSMQIRSVCGFGFGVLGLTIKMLHVCLKEVIFWEGNWFELVRRYNDLMQTSVDSVDSNPFYLYTVFKNRHCQKAVLQKSRCRFIWVLSRFISTECVVRMLCTSRLWISILGGEQDSNVIKVCVRVHY